MKTFFVTAAEFNRNPSKVKTKTREGRVVITERGKSSHVLMSFADYEANLARPARTLLDLRDPRPEADRPFEPATTVFAERDIAW
ncbi:type II toxin-antitoxin system Phd/YefM family antitoxin [Jiella sp. M17.18]|uniref:type II toxin-antitoxin system Phd/YefM family antitoxin n=1 Tax=Jiella sp. M17.18 TaxID=3234247 RepID=UPI0034DFDD95